MNNSTQRIDNMTDANLLYATFLTWVLTVLGYISVVLPLLQAASFILAIIVSGITIYKFIKEKRTKHRNRYNGKF